LITKQLGWIDRVDGCAWEREADSFVWCLARARVSPTSATTSTPPRRDVLTHHQPTSHTIPLSHTHTHIRTQHGDGEQRRSCSVDRSSSALQSVLGTHARLGLVVARYLDTVVCEFESRVGSIIDGVGYVVVVCRDICSRYRANTCVCLVVRSLILGIAPPWLAELLVYLGTYSRSRPSSLYHPKSPLISLLLTQTHKHTQTHTNTHKHTHTHTHTRRRWSRHRELDGVRLGCEGLALSSLHLRIGW